MPDRKMTTTLRILILFLLFLPVGVTPVLARDLTQRDWMIELVNTLDLSFGLPDQPQDPDYVTILEGQRTFRFEAEEVYTPEEDEVSKMNFRNFGPFSGDAWLNGLSRPTRVQLRFTLPLSGSYRLSASLRNGEHLFQIGSRTLVGFGDSMFSPVELGDLELEAGPQEVVVTLPAGGAIDYIELNAPALAPISPRLGWQPGQSLGWDDVFVTLLQVFDLGELLAEAGDPQPVEAENLELDADRTFSVTDIEHLGRPSGGRWLRAGNLPGRLEFSLDLNQGSYYRPSLRLLGQNVEVEFNRQINLDLAGLPYLEDFTLPALFLRPGVNRVALTFPPGGGLDRLTLTRLDTSSPATRRLLGLDPATPNPQDTDLEQLVKQLAAFGISR